jgi:hypothetical protein
VHTTINQRPLSGTTSQDSNLQLYWKAVSVAKVDPTI